MSKERRIEDKDLSKITGGAVDVQPTPRVGGPQPPTGTKSEGGSTPGGPGVDTDTTGTGGDTTDFNAH